MPIPRPAPAAVTVSGQVTFDFVPVVPARGLDYAATVARPARAVTVELLQNGAVTASTTTDATGNYSFGNVGANTDVALRVRAEMLRVGAPSWDFRVVDNVNGDALYTLAGAVFNTGAANLTRNLHAASGWTGAAYTATRSAAPFAILDVAYDAVAAGADRGAEHGVSGATLQLEHAERAGCRYGSRRDRLEPLPNRRGHLSRRRGRSRYRRVRPARHRARVRSLSRASVLALRQCRRPARADGSDRLPCRLRRSLGKRIRGDGDGAARLRRRAQRGSSASVQLRSRATAGPRESESRLVQ